MHRGNKIMKEHKIVKSNKNGVCVWVGVIRGVSHGNAKRSTVARCFSQPLSTPRPLLYWIRLKFKRGNLGVTKMGTGLKKRGMGERWQLQPPPSSSNAPLLHCQSSLDSALGWRCSLDQFVSHYFAFKWDVIGLMWGEPWPAVFQAVLLEMLQRGLET